MSLTSSNKETFLEDVAIEVIDSYEQCLYTPCPHTAKSCKECIKEHLDKGEAPNVKK